MELQITHIRKEDYLTTNWSGGTTTQLAIAPTGAQYAQREFLWRLSSATVEADTSEFTPLPDYLRFLAPLDGALHLCSDGVDTPLSPLDFLSFDGAAPTVSRGKVRDFNLMLRKGKCRGDCSSLQLPQAAVWQLSGPLPCCGPLTRALYVVEGTVSLSHAGTDYLIPAGDLLLLHWEEDSCCRSGVRLLAKTSASLIASAIYYLEV